MCNVLRVCVLFLPLIVLVVPGPVLVLPLHARGGRRRRVPLAGVRSAVAATATAVVDPATERLGPGIKQEQGIDTT